MNPSWKTVSSAILGACALLIPAGHARAQSAASAGPRISSTQDQWKQRVLRSAQPWSPNRSSRTWTPVAPVSDRLQSNVIGHESYLAADEPLLDDMGPLPGDLNLDVMPMEGDYFGPGDCDTCDEGCGAGYGPDCAVHGHPYYGWGPHCALQRWWQCSSWWIQKLSFFGGVHGFKGPADQGRNGNFGFHEGVNFGAPLGGPFGIGYQLGFQAAHSNFSGDQTSNLVRTSDRDQIFFTGGLFRRAVCGGWQWGVAYDLLHDVYYGTADLQQIRTESAYVFSGCREIGFWGNFGVGEDAFTFDAAERVTQPIGPSDTYSLFYRRHFSGGGQGRIWAGLSGEGDALIGADCTVPLGTSWALENNFAYLVPQEGKGNGGQQDETWNVSIQLVWYPGRQARCVLSEPFHPLFNVADNSLFILDERQ